MERDVEIYLEDQYLDTFFEDRIQKIVVHPLKPGNFFKNSTLKSEITQITKLIRKFQVCVFGCKK